MERKKIYYTTYEVSKFFNVYPTTVINWINGGILPAFTTPGGHRRIKKEDIITLMKKHNTPIPQELMKDAKYKILVIDDDVQILNMIKTILEVEEDFDVSLAKSGFEAGSKLTQWLPDIILLDFLMPGMDGFEVCRSIRGEEATKNIPVIAITALRDEKDIKRMQSAGITDYLNKPFRSEALLEKIRAHLLG